MTGYAAELEAIARLRSMGAVRIRFEGPGLIDVDFARPVESVQSKPSESDSERKEREAKEFEETLFHSAG